jgi:pimeloyl-ACP methyl ester carboxylesterase
MAARYAGEICRHQPHGPYHLIAYCAGGALAFEVARQLDAAVEKIGFLGIIDYRAPKQKPAGFFWPLYYYVNDNIGGARVRIAGFLLAPAREKARQFLGIPGFMAGKVQRLPADVATRPVPPVIQPEARYPDWVLGLPESQRSITMRIFDAIAGYTPLPCGVKATIFISSDLVRRSRRAGTYDRHLGWKRLARGGVVRHIIMGDHGTIISPENWNKIGRVVRKNIDRSVHDMKARERPGNGL